MAISPETFAQVKDILRKLDRSIDDARTRRTRTGTDLGSTAGSDEVIGGGNGLREPNGNGGHGIGDTPIGRARPKDRPAGGGF